MKGASISAGEIHVCLGLHDLKLQRRGSSRNFKIAVTTVISECVEDEEASLGEFLNHTGPVHGLQVHDGLLYTCSGDNTARAYSLTVSGLWSKTTYTDEVKLYISRCLLVNKSTG